MSLMSHDRGPVDKKGPIGWMAAHPVAANLLMGVLVIGGILFAFGTKREVFPEIDMDMVTVVVAYPGASPQEVEEGVVLAIEDEIRSLDGIKRIGSVSVEGLGTVTAEILTSANPDRTYNDVKSTVDRITSFPQDAERPVISLMTNRRQVLSLLVHGDMDLKSLDGLAEEIRNELLSDERITLVEKAGIPPPEISVEVPADNLRRYGLTLPQISTAVRAASIDLPGGSVKTEGGEVLVRTTERRDYGEEFRDITLIARADGTRVRLRDVATVVDGFRETDEELYYNGQPAIDLQVYRVGNEVPLQVSSAVYDLVERRRGTLPDSVGISIVNDESEDYQARLSTLGKNGLIGLLLVVTVLGIFLRPAVAFWVSLGIFISFCGSFFLIPILGVSLNMISLFAFILVLGIAVDDAVVVGEAIFHHRRGGDRLEAAIVGTREVLTPVTFAVITTIIAFIPLAIVPGITGKFFRNIPFIVIPVLLLSLIESVFILPAHLRHVGRTKLRGRKGKRRSLNPLKKLGAVQLRFSEWVERTIAGQVPPIVRRLVRDRYLTVAAMFSALVVAVSFVAGGHIKFNFFPRIEGEFANGVIELPFGAPVADTREVSRLMTRAAEEVGAEAPGGRADAPGSRRHDAGHRLPGARGEDRNHGHRRLRPRSGLRGDRRARRRGDGPPRAGRGARVRLGGVHRTLARPGGRGLGCGPAVLRLQRRSLGGRQGLGPARAPPDASARGRGGARRRVAGDLRRRVRRRRRLQGRQAAARPGAQAGCQGPGTHRAGPGGPGPRRLLRRRSQPPAAGPRRTAGLRPPSP